MADTCYADLEKILTEILGDNIQAQKDILRSIEDRAQLRQTKYLERRAMAYRKTVEEIKKELEIKKNVLRKLYTWNRVVNKRAAEQIDEFKRNPMKGVYAYIGGVQSNIKKSRLSISGNMQKREREVFTLLYSNLSEKNVFDVFAAPEYDELIGKELWGQDTGNTQAIAVREAIQKTQSYIKAKLLQMGMNLPEAEDYIAKTVHRVDSMLSPTSTVWGNMKLRARLYARFKSSTRVSDELYNIAFERWKAFIKPLTNNAKTFERIPDEKQDEFWRSFYEAVTTGIRKNPMGNIGSPFFSFGKNLSRGLLEERKWFAKDAESWIAYNKEYGHGNVRTAIFNQIRETGNLIGLVERATWNPSNFFERFLMRGRQKGRTHSQTQLYTRRSRAVINQILNPANISKNLFSQIMEAFRLSQYFQLGGITIHSLADVNTMASGLRPLGVSYLRTVERSFSNFFKDLPEDELKNVALKLSIYSQGGMGNVIRRFGTIDTPIGAFEKGMEILGKVSGIDRLDRTGLYTAGMEVSNSIANTLSQDFDSLTPSLKRIFNIYGIDKEEFNLFKKNSNSLLNIRGIKFFTEDIVHYLKNKDIKEYLKKIKKYKSIKKIHINLMREELRDRIGSLINDQTFTAKVMPDISDYATLRGGEKLSGFLSPVWRSMTQFLVWHVAQFKRTFIRFYGSQGADNILEAIFDPQYRGDIAGMIKYMLGSLPFGYLSVVASAIIEGKTIPSLDDPRTWSRVLTYGDTFGLYGAFMTDLVNTDASSLVTNIMGKPIQTFAELVTLFNRMATNKKFGTQLINLIQYNSGIRNLPFAKAAVDRLIFDKLHERIDPTYRQKLIANAAKNGQSYIWSP